MIKNVLFLQVIIHFILGFAFFLFPALFYTGEINEIISLNAILLCMISVLLFYMLHKFELTKIDKRFYLYLMMYNVIVGLHSYNLYRHDLFTIYLFIIFLLLALVTLVGYYKELNKFEK